MRLRSQLLALSLLTLLLPWSGWKLVQELENFLREADENTLLESARTVAQVLPLEYQAELKLARGQLLPLRRLTTEPVLDGYLTDWPQAGQSLVFESAAGDLKLDVLAGRYGSRYYLALRVTDPGEIRATTYNTGISAAAERAGVVLFIQNARGQRSYMIATEAPGLLTVNSHDKGSRLDAAWVDDADGYQIELSLPAEVERISIGAVAPAHTLAGFSSERYAGTLNGRLQGQWLELVSRDDAVAQWLSIMAPEKSRAWLVQADGWVMADSGPDKTAGSSELTWVQRMLYQAVSDSRMALREDLPLWPVRFESEPVGTAMQGGNGSLWSRDADSAVVYNRVAVPVYSEKNSPANVIGAVLLETRSEGLLLMTNRALGRFSLIALSLMVVLALGLWLFASRLSRRVQKLSSAVSRSMEQSGQVPELPLTTSGDELGELARNTEKLLRAVAEYTHYLQKLAGRLSHELKTPIAITRSSLENLSESLADRDLDPQAAEYLARAREGLDRQAAIVAAMSEAQRLEGAVRTADWETIKLDEMLKHSVAAYRSLNPSRTIKLDLPADGCELLCAPDLIAQALDKLVDNAVTLSDQDCEIRISLSSEDGECLIAVANNGSRLPDVLHGQLFDSLVSLRDKRGSGQHLGLGLHIVRLVAEAHGGRVEACNLPDDAGVEFTIRLPIS